jgi:hypothetical protein
MGSLLALGAHANKRHGQFHGIAMHEMRRTSMRLISVLLSSSPPAELTFQPNCFAGGRLR